jgi:hypothetical protein
VVDRLLIAIVVVTHTAIALAFVLTDGPDGSPVVLKVSSTHGIHGSDVPILVLWLTGVSACVGLTTRHWRRT